MTETARIALSARERQLLTGWERAGLRTVTLDEIRRQTHANARLIASRLVRKRVLVRIARGLYAVRPFRSIGMDWAFPALAAVERILGSHPHYVGGLAAYTLHRLTSQQHSSRLDVFLTGARRPRRIGNAFVTFHVRDARVFRSGTTRIPVDEVPVLVSDPERTVLDSLDQFRVVGGMREAILLFSNAVHRIDPDRLVADALAIARASTTQRLGLLLEREGIEGAFVDKLRKRASDGSIHVLVPGRPRRGPTHPLWKIVEND